MAAYSSTLTQNGGAPKCGAVSFLTSLKTTLTLALEPVWHAEPIDMAACEHFPRPSNKGHPVGHESYATKRS